MNQTFAWLMSATSLWMVSAFLSQKTPESASALLLVRLAFVAAAAIALFALLFAAVFPNGTRTIYTRRFWWTAWGLGIVMMVLSGSSWMIEEVTLFPWGANVVPGPLYPLFLVYFVGFLGAGLWQIYARWQASMGLVRHQIAYLLTGFVLTALVGSTTNLILPLLTGTNPYAQYGPISSLFVAGFTGYAILTRRLFDIRLLAGKTLVTLGLLLFVWGMYFVASTYLSELLLRGPSLSVSSPSSTPSSRITTLLAGLVVALAFAPLKNGLERAAERLLFPRGRKRR